MQQDRNQITSNRYFKPLCEVRLTQSGPQPQLALHSKIIALGSINLRESERERETNQVVDTPYKRQT